MKDPLSAIFLLATVASLQAAPAFPLTVSENRRHLVDQRGAPFLYHADTPWMILLKLTEAESKEYIARTGTLAWEALRHVRQRAVNSRWRQRPNNARAEIRALGLGLKDTGPKQLITYHSASSHSSRPPTVIGCWCWMTREELS